MAMRMGLIGTISFTLSNIPHISASTDEATIFFSVWKTVRMGPFSFGSDVSVVVG